MYHILTLWTDPTLTWSGVCYNGPARLANDPIEMYACCFSKNTFLLQFSIKTYLGAVFECRLLNRCSRCTEKMHVRGWNCLYPFYLHIIGCSLYFKFVLNFKHIKSCAWFTKVGRKTLELRYFIIEKSSPRSQIWGLKVIIKTQIQEFFPFFPFLFPKSS